MVVAGGRVDDVVFAQALIHVDRHAFPDPEGADAARRVAGQVLHLVSRDHFCLDVEGILVFAVVHAGGSLRYDQDRAFLCQEGKGLGDLARGHADGLSGELNGGRRGLRNDDPVLQAELLQVF